MQSIGKKKGWLKKTPRHWEKENKVNAHTLCRVAFFSASPFFPKHEMWRVFRSLARSPCYIVLIDTKFF